VQECTLWSIQIAKCTFATLISKSCEAHKVSILKVRIRFAFKLSNLQTPFKIVLVHSFGDGDKTINDFLMSFQVKTNFDLGL